MEEVESEWAVVEEVKVVVTQEEAILEVLANHQRNQQNQQKKQQKCRPKESQITLACFGYRQFRIQQKN